MAVAGFEQQPRQSDSELLSHKNAQFKDVSFHTSYHQESVFAKIAKQERVETLIF